jgi:predicted O-linked N-acetylglucosamine transferase (SPINDLY family)
MAGRNLAALLAEARRRHQAGALAEAEALYRRLLDGPLAAPAATGLGLIVEVGDPAAGLALHDRAIALDPDLAEAWCNRGDLHYQADRLEAALADFRRAAELDPGLAPAWFNLGNTLTRLGRPGEAAEAHRQAHALLPAHPGVALQLARTLATAERWDEAAEAYAAVITLTRGAAEGWRGQAVALQALGRMAEADDCATRAIALEPGNPLAAYTRGNGLYAQGRAAEAGDCFRRAVELAPRFAEAAANHLNCLHYRPGLDGAEVAAAHRAVAAAFARPPLPGACAPRGGRIRIGYVSAGFRRHPIGLLAGPVILAHDRARFHVTCYANGGAADAVTAGLRDSVDAWREVGGLADEDLATRVRADAIDLLVDLDGWTAGSRLPAFALKPAPVQASWLGYPFTTGMDAIDLVVMDRATVPEAAEAWFTERVAVLPVRFPYAGAREAPEPALPSGPVTFGSFNNLAKLTPEVAALWRRILDAVPGSRLLLKWPQLACPEIAARVRGLFPDLGERLDLRGDSPPAQLLAEYGDVDVALDPFPYSGSVTSCEALWMGVPVVTLPGARPFSRQTLALLSAIGHPELAAADPGAYVALALALAADRDRRAAYRQSLRAAMQAGLSDVAGFTRELERQWELALALAR